MRSKKGSGKANARKACNSFPKSGITLHNSERMGWDSNRRASQVFGNPGFDKKQPKSRSSGMGTLLPSQPEGLVRGNLRGWRIGENCLPPKGKGGKSADLGNILGLTSKTVRY